MPLSPIQNSAGGNRIFEPGGFLRLSGVYSPGQPNISPWQRLPATWRCLAKAFTSLKSVTTAGIQLLPCESMMMIARHAGQSNRISHHDGSYSSGSEAVAERSLVI